MDKSRTLKTFGYTFFIVLLLLFSALCIFRIYYACEDVISGSHSAFSIQKTGSGATYYLRSKNKTYEIEPTAGVRLTKKITDDIKKSPAAFPDAITLIYYAKQTLDELTE